MTARASQDYILHQKIREGRPEELWHQQQSISLIHEPDRQPLSHPDAKGGRLFILWFYQTRKLLQQERKYGYETVLILRKTDGGVARRGRALHRQCLFDVGKQISTVFNADG